MRVHGIRAGALAAGTMGVGLGGACFAPAPRNRTAHTAAYVVDGGIIVGSIIWAILRKPCNDSGSSGYTFCFDQRTAAIATATLGAFGAFFNFSMGDTSAPPPARASESEPPTRHGLGAYGELSGWIGATTRPAGGPILAIDGRAAAGIVYRWPSAAAQLGATFDVMKNDPASVTAGGEAEYDRAVGAGWTMGPRLAVSTEVIDSGTFHSIDLGSIGVRARRGEVVLGIDGVAATLEHDVCGGVPFDQCQRGLEVIFGAGLRVW